MCPGHDSCEICTLNSKYFSRYGHFSILANWIWHFFNVKKNRYVIPWGDRFKGLPPSCYTDPDCNEPKIENLYLEYSGLPYNKSQNYRRHVN